ncbi:MAG: tetratricopeptide repeat protein [Chitinophagaceae bacterium]|nr:MAG: tetratricopeptide repeat protein [Chitinophagaceae bacterium]
MTVKDILDYLLRLCRRSAIEILVSEKRKIKRSNKKAILAISFLLFILPSFAQDANELIRDGNALYKRGEYENAAGHYQAAAGKSDDFVANLNLGNALFRMKKTDEAVSAYDRALQKASLPEDRAEIFFNKGVVLQMNNKVPECIEAYKQALKLKPDDEEARQNLQKALKKQKQDQQNQQQKQNNNNKQNQNKSQSRMSKQEAEEKLKALQQQERNLHDKLKKGDPEPVNRPEKDW